MTGMESHLSEVLRQVDAHKAEDKKRRGREEERKRREEARMAKAARVEDVNSDMDVTEDGRRGEGEDEG